MAAEVLLYLVWDPQEKLSEESDHKPKLYQLVISGKEHLHSTKTWSDFIFIIETLSILV